MNEALYLLINAIPGLPVTDEDRLQDPLQRQHFVGQVSRWHQQHGSGLTK